MTTLTLLLSQIQIFKSVQWLNTNLNTNTEKLLINTQTDAITVVLVTSHSQY